MNVSRAEPLLSTARHFGVFSGFPAFWALRSSARLLWPSLRRTREMAIRIKPRAMSAAGLRVLCAVLIAPDPSTAKPIRIPRAMLVI